MCDKSEVCEIYNLIRCEHEIQVERRCLSIRELQRAIEAYRQRIKKAIETARKEVAFLKEVLEGRFQDHGPEVEIHSSLSTIGSHGVYYFLKDRQTVIAGVNGKHLGKFVGAKREKRPKRRLSATSFYKMTLDPHVKDHSVSEEGESFAEMEKNTTPTGTVSSISSYAFTTFGLAFLFSQWSSISPMAISSAHQRDGPPLLDLCFLRHIDAPNYVTLLSSHCETIMPLMKRDLRFRSNRKHGRTYIMQVSE
ncbi:hypothetical protein KIN20_015219 [Parelaphostrongylus tenuis]|uniref:Uncharacterized protein n=1 Tax=Parelaphostrongylus tenuis TaxID=148309 RepID=A0AAD5MEK2_PARTN|nr:hypothetical protein KIN20_015219 [Parelaphostrongylus tenuis]